MSETRAFTKEQHLRAGGPKRILALDGGGVRGIVAIAFLEKIESILKARFESQLRGTLNDPNYSFRLCDYFDMIGGTSTGAILAAGLAMGHSAGYLKERYFSIADRVFKKQTLLGVFRSRFNHDHLREELQKEFGDMTMESDRLKTGLAIFLKNSDSNSPWVISNNPERKFWNGDPKNPGSGIIPMRQYKLKEVVSGSTAAPYYFKSQPIRIDGSDPGFSFNFIDGGLSPFNNPSLGLLDLVTLKAYGLEWTKGPDDILMINVGTGQFGPDRPESGWFGWLNVAKSIRDLRGLIEDIENFAVRRAMLRANTLTPWYLDRDLEDLQDERHGEDMTLARYNIYLDPVWIKAHAGTTMSKEDVLKLYDMTLVDIMKNCYSIAATTASRKLEPGVLPEDHKYNRDYRVLQDHFKPGFNIT